MPTYDMIARHSDPPKTISTIATVPTIPIDPALTGFLTDGPNDSVPPGFHAMPHSMLPDLVTCQDMTHPPNPIPPTIVGGPVTLDRLAQMLVALEGRLTLQERCHVDQELQHQSNPPVVVAVPTEEHPAIVESRPRTWPTRATPAQTRSKVTQSTSESNALGEGHERPMHGGNGRRHARTKAKQTDGLQLEVKDKPE
jgi:hypothetical protein